MPTTIAATLSTTLEIPPEALTIIAPLPELLSQRNVEAVTGIPARVYLEEVRTPGFPLPVMRLGKLRLVKRVAFVAYLESLTARPVPTPHRGDDGAADDVATVLAEVGCEPLAPGPARAKELRPSRPELRRRGATGSR
jgi:hypothetical protein